MAVDIQYGFLQLRDIFRDRLADNIEEVNDAIERTIDEHNRQIDALLDLFCERTTEFKARFRLMAQHRLQPLDQNGRARPIKGGGFYDVAFPLQMAGSAWGENYLTSQKRTVEDANNITASMLLADIRWVRDHLLAALFMNADWTFEDDEHGALVVRPLANGDGDEYQLVTGNDLGVVNHSHFYATATAISDAANPMPTVADHLREHPENQGGELLLLAGKNVAAAVGNLATFAVQTDPNIRQGANADELVGTFGGQTPGVMTGYERASQMFVSRWDHFPADYFVAIATGAAIRPLAMREEEIDELRGFKKVAERNDHPFMESQYQRIAGFGAWNRVGAVVGRTGNAAYAVPANYSTPMP